MLKYISKTDRYNSYLDKNYTFDDLADAIDENIKNILRKRETEKEAFLFEQFQEVVDKSAIISKTDENGIITYANEYFCLISGYSQSELIGKSYNIVRDPSLPKDFFRKMWHELKQNSYFKGKLSNKAKDGSIYYVDVTIMPIYTKEGFLQEYVAISLDTTALHQNMRILEQAQEENDVLLEENQNLIEELHQERLELERSLKKEIQANRSKEQFYANISHELRTPLNGIVGFSQAIEEVENLPPLAKEYISIINESASTLVSIINDILDISKIQENKLMLENRFYDFEYEIKMCFDLYRTIAQEKHIRYNLSIDSVVPHYISFDKVRLKQVLTNLISNAMKFTPAEKTVDLNIRFLSIDQNATKVKLRFEVADTGIGMSQENLQNIFKPFTQADESTTRKYGGTGLGLTIAFKLVEIFGGELKVESILGIGTKFYFDVELPCKHELEVNIKAKKQKLEKDIYQGIVLVAEDVIINQKLIEIMLDKFGLDVVMVENGKDAVETFTEEPEKFCLIFMDINMPIMDGMEACNKINEYKEQNNMANPPIVALTANASHGDKQKYLSLGFDEYISKPIIKENLELLLHKHLAVTKSCPVSDEVVDENSSKNIEDKSSDSQKQSFCLTGLLLCHHGLDILFIW
jgi:PAS domain S-box-containing protein